MHPTLMVLHKQINRQETFCSRYAEARSFEREKKRAFSRAQPYISAKVEGKR